jgi:predicted aspartyl protease
MGTQSQASTATRKGAPSMGLVTVTIKVENYVDWARAQTATGPRKPRIRTVIIPDALVDTGTMHLCLPRRYIKALGLLPLPGKMMAETANGLVERTVYGGAQLTLQGRLDEFHVTELPDTVPALVGVIPLEALDFVVDPTTQSLVGKHGKKRVTVMY